VEETAQPRVIAFRPVAGTFGRRILSGRWRRDGAGEDGAAGGLSGTSRSRERGERTRGRRRDARPRRDANSPGGGRNAAHTDAGSARGMRDGSADQFGRVATCGRAAPPHDSDPEKLGRDPGPSIGKQLLVEFNAQCADDRSIGRGRGPCIRAAAGDRAKGRGWRKTSARSTPGEPRPQHRASINRKKARTGATWHPVAKIGGSGGDGRATWTRAPGGCQSSPAASEQGAPDNRVSVITEAASPLHSTPEPDMAPGSDVDMGRRRDRIGAWRSSTIEPQRNPDGARREASRAMRSRGATRRSRGTRGEPRRFCSPANVRRRYAPRVAYAGRTAGGATSRGARITQQWRSRGVPGRRPPSLLQVTNAPCRVVISPCQGASGTWDPDDMAKPQLPTRCAEVAVKGGAHGAW
jgi:hypothetical protein